MAKKPPRTKNRDNARRSKKKVSVLVSEGVDYDIEYVGKIKTALFGGGSYGAHVDAETDVELAVITPESFAGKIQSSDPMVRAIVQMLMERLKKTNEALLKSETREFMDIALV